MAKRNSRNGAQKKKYTPQSLIITLIGALIVALSALVGYLLDLDDPAVTPPPPAATIDAPATTPIPGDVTTFMLDQGFGAEKGFWTVYFTAPTGSRDFETYFGGVDEAIAEAIDNVQGTLDIAAFEWNSPALTEAVINAHNRGVQVRMVVDREHALESSSGTISQVIDAGVPVVDDGRTGFMHNKFMILDSQIVITGSMNFTINDVYRNNNNMLKLRSRRAVEAYQNNFDEMFIEGIFARSGSDHHGISFNQDGTPISILFSPEGDVVDALVDQIERAQESIVFMTFSFTLDEVGQAILRQSEAGVDVRGIFELRGSRTQWSQLPPMFCAGLNVLQDGNPFTFHHKVFVIDARVVVTGSFNISNNATTRNDENVVIIEDADLAALYLEEFERVSTQATIPPSDAITCP